MNNAIAAVFSLDVPSGVDCDAAKAAEGRSRRISPSPSTIPEALPSSPRQGIAGMWNSAPSASLKRRQMG